MVLAKFVQNQRPQISCEDYFGAASWGTFFGAARWGRFLRFIYINFQRAENRKFGHRTETFSVDMIEPWIWSVIKSFFPF